ncbi:MAG: hypothetical protein ABIQ35_06425, partial [Verrucomicrobiota bacterium]
MKTLRVKILNGCGLFFFAALILSGCSSFNRDWKKAGTVRSPGPVGQWQGTWTSLPSGHTDKLRCLVEKVSEERYRARFDSTYKKVIHFKSTVILNGETTNSVFEFN